MLNTLQDCIDIELDDDSLVMMAQNGESNAFSKLVQRHYAHCLRLAMSILHERGGAEDEVQNAFLNAYRHIGQFRLDAQFSAWLSRIVLNQCRMHLRRTRRARAIYVDQPSNYERSKPLSLQDKGKSPYQELFGKQMTAAVLNEAGRMPVVLREVFLLTHVKELPMNEVASELGISVAATKSRLLRARSILRDRLNRWGTQKENDSAMRNAPFHPQSGA